jgi:hypothetical protein
MPPPPAVEATVIVAVDKLLFTTAEPITIAFADKSPLIATPELTVVTTLFIAPLIFPQITFT